MHSDWNCDALESVDGRVDVNHTLRSPGQARYWVEGQYHGLRPREHPDITLSEGKLRADFSLVQDTIAHCDTLDAGAHLGHGYGVVAGRPDYNGGDTSAARKDHP